MHWVTEKVTITLWVLERKKWRRGSIGLCFNGVCACVPVWLAGCVYVCIDALAQTRMWGSQGSALNVFLYYSHISFYTNLELAASTQTSCQQTLGSHPSIPHPQYWVYGRHTAVLGFYMSANKTLFTRTGSGLALTQGPELADLCFTAKVRVPCAREGRNPRLSDPSQRPDHCGCKLTKRESSQLTEQANNKRVLKIIKIENWLSGPEQIYATGPCSAGSGGRASKLCVEQAKHFFRLFPA